MSKNKQSFSANKQDFSAKRQRFLEKKVFIIIFLICFIILLPSFFLPWSLIDDGDVVQTSQQLLINLQSLNLDGIFSIVWESSIGRFRPAYWIYNLFSYFIGRENPFPYHFLRFLNFFTTCLLIFLISRKIKSSRAGIFSLLLFSTSFLGFENWYRLGPQEPLSTLLLALSFFFLMNKKFVFSFWLILASFMVKETNVFLIFVVFFMYVLNLKLKVLEKNSLKKLLLKTTVLGLLMVGILGIIKSGGGYSSNYQTNPDLIADNFKKYFFYLRDYLGYLPIVSAVGLFLAKKEKSETFWTANYIVISIISLLIMLPWQFPLGRYLLPTFFFFSIFLGIGLDNFIKLFGKNILLKIAVSYYFIGIIIQNVVISSGTFYDYTQREKVNSELVAYLASEVKPEQTVYFNINKSAMEYMEETKIHLNIFYSKKNTKISLMEEQKSPQKGDLIIESYILRNNYTLPQGLTRQKLIEKNFKTLIVTTPTSFVKRMAMWVYGILRGNYNIPEGIYTFYKGRYFWEIFRVN